MKISDIKCDYKGCKNLTCDIVKMSDLPEFVLGSITPSYEVFVKLCPDHGLDVETEQLEFVVINNNPWPDWAPYSYHCVRCDHEWNSNYLYNKHEEYGKLPVTCPHCHSMYWYKEPRLRREVTAGTAKPGKNWKETDIWHKVKEAAK